MSSTTAGKTPATKISKKTSHEANFREMTQHHNSKGPFSSLFLVCSDTSLVSGIARANERSAVHSRPVLSQGMGNFVAPITQF